jgi:hypothetical protein
MTRECSPSSGDRAVGGGPAGRGYILFEQRAPASPTRVPRDTFLLAAAKSLSEQSELFTGTKLDQPNKLKLISQEALEVLQSLPQTKETKSLTDKIQARLKKARITL